MIWLTVFLAVIWLGLWKLSSLTAKSARRNQTDRIMRRRDRLRTEWYLRAILDRRD